MTGPRQTLDILASWNIRGTDASTALDTFCLRAGAHLAAEMAGMTHEDQHNLLVDRFGSDAVRVAIALARRGNA